MGFRLETLRRVVVALACGVTAGWVHAQDNPANGKVLFEGNSVQPCTQCHVNVDNRRTAIDANGDLDFDLVYATFLTAIATQGGMVQFNSGLTTQQKRNIAAYIADVPKARPNLVDFAASGVNTETAATPITFGNAVTATSSLTINSVGLTGSSSDFLIKTAGTTCGTSVTLSAGASCNVNVSFRTGTSSTKTALLNITYTQGAVTTTRTAQLSGTVAGQPPPAGTSASGGGGALPAAGLGLLLLAATWRRRR